MAQLMTIGEILVEIMAERVGQTFLAAGKFEGPFASGAPAISIDQAARLGADCAIISCVGDDDFGRLNIDRLKADGVDTSGIVVRGDKTTGVAFVTYREDGSRQFIYHFTDAAAGALTPEDVREEMFEGVRVLHLMGCSLSTSASMREAIMKGARIAKAGGARISFDPNLRTELLGIREIRQAFAWIMDHCDILLTGREEIELLTGLPVDEAIRQQREVGTAIVVVKSGSRGARIVSDAADQQIPSFKVEEVDPTGAGDCFDGAFLAMLLAGKSPAEAARVANAAGAFSVTRKGPMEGAATREEIEAMLRT